MNITHITNPNCDLDFVAYGARFILVSVFLQNHQ